MCSRRREDIANARMVFANGCVANINTSRVSLKKVARNPGLSSAGLSVPQLHGAEWPSHSQGRRVSPPRGYPHRERDEPLKLELISFIDCVRRGAGS